MSTAGVGIDDFGASFIHYLPGVIETLNNTTNARKIPLASFEWEGEKVVKHVHMHRNGAITNTADGGAIPPAGKQGYEPAAAKRKFVVASAKVTDGILKNAATTKRAAIRVTDSELNGLMDNVRVYENFFWTRDGTGVVARMGATVSDTSAPFEITVDDARGLWDKKDYEIRDSATTTTIHANFTVQKTARALTAAGEATVTLQASLASLGQATGDYVVWGTGIYSAWNKTITGLDKLIDDALVADFQEISTTDNPRYTSPVFDNGGTARAITPRLMREVLATIKQESGDDENTIVLTSLWDIISFEELFEGDVRITPDAKTVGLDMPTFQTAFGKVTPMPDQHMDYGTMLFIDRNEIAFAKQKDLDWRREQGGGIFKRSDTNLAWTATAMAMYELMIYQRNRCAKLTDLTVDPKTAY